MTVFFHIKISAVAIIFLIAHGESQEPEVQQQEVQQQHNVILKHAETGKCIDIAGQNKKPGAYVVMYTCTNSKWQMFHTQPGTTEDSLRFGTMLHPKPTTCIGGATYDGGQVVTFGCEGAPKWSTSFRLKKVGDGNRVLIQDVLWRNNQVFCLRPNEINWMKSVKCDPKDKRQHFLQCFDNHKNCQ